MGEQPKVISWGEEPPPPRTNARSGNSRWSRVYEDLLAHPGEWAYLGEFPKDGPGSFPTGPFKAKGFVTTTRQVADSPNVKVWAIYKPPQAPLTPDDEALIARWEAEAGS